MINEKRAAVFLDRDGVLNRAYVRDGRPFPPETMVQLEILEEARTACKRLKLAGFPLICVTNQPDISRATTDRSKVDEMNACIQRQLHLDAVYVCPHDDDYGCDCRKPKPGLLKLGSSDFGIDLNSSYMIGDRWRDIEAGQTAGCQTIFIQRDYDESQPKNPSVIVDSTEAAAAWILTHHAKVGSFHV